MGLLKYPIWTGPMADPVGSLPVDLHTLKPA